jgi:D-alanyl-D-alanine carboxypeptidase
MFSIIPEVWAAQTSSIKNIEAQKNAALVMDSNTGTVLFQENAHKSRYPASLTKVMTIYLTFEALKNGDLESNQLLTVSNYAATRPKVNMGLRAGEKISVKDAIACSIIKSANDTATVLAEAIAGSESEFAKQMTRKAKELGMYNTTFRNASGLHHPEQKTTAYDMAIMALNMVRDHPEYYHLFAKKNFSFRGKSFQGHNRVLNHYYGATGLKTGFVNASGFNLITSAQRGTEKLIGVVMGGSTAHARDQKMMSLLDQHFQDKKYVQTEHMSSKLMQNEQTKRVATGKVIKKKVVKASKQIAKPKPKKTSKKNTNKATTKKVATKV